MAVRSGMSSAAASRAASGTKAHGRSWQLSDPYDQIAVATSSQAHSVSAVRPKPRGASTTPRNSQLPKLIHTVSAAATSMPHHGRRATGVRQATQALKGASRAPTYHHVRLAPILIAAAVLAAPASAHAASLGGWNKPEQRKVASAGLLPKLEDGRFHGERPLSGAQLSAALGEPSASAARTVSVTAFDARLVNHLGLADVAAHVEDVARGAGLHPPRTFGTEVVARLIGLRTNHPAGDETLELYPWEPITRAEAAHSLAVMLDEGDWAAGNARAQLSAFELPEYPAPTRAKLALAASKIGMPYVWGGETDGVSPGQAHGGYDCSGFVWRVFTPQRIGGRTAAQMAGQIRKSARVRFDDVRPGDLLFFGPASLNSKATERSIVHVGIALSQHWMIHSSGQGVYISSLDDDWRRDEFAWARRP